ncbi:MAG: hypothetical protein U0235_02865 [Polyangiaceae bacterium]
MLILERVHELVRDDSIFARAEVVPYEELVGAEVIKADVASAGYRRA